MRLPGTSPLLLLQLHRQQQLLSINTINSTNHLQRAKLRILLQHLTSHAAYERSGGPSKRPAAKRPCKHIYLHTRALSGQHPDAFALSALEPFFVDFSAARPHLVARLAPSDSPQPRGPCPRAGPPSPRPYSQR